MTATKAERAARQRARRAAARGAHLDDAVERAARAFHAASADWTSEERRRAWGALTPAKRSDYLSAVRPLVLAAFEGGPGEAARLAADVAAVTAERDRARRVAAALMDEDRARGYDVATMPILGAWGPEGDQLRVHDRDTCAGETCAIHHPSDHPLRHAPLQWRSDRRRLERVCEHGVGHPDPDAISFARSKGFDVDETHGCCGICCNRGES